LKQWLSMFYLLLPLLCGLGLLQPSATAADESPFLRSDIASIFEDTTTEPLEDGKTFRQTLPMRCRQETLPKTTQNFSNTSILRTVLLKKDGGIFVASLLRAGQWATENSADFFPCGRPTNLALVQKAILKLNQQMLQEVLSEIKKKPNSLNALRKEFITTTAKPTLEEGGILSIELVGKPIREVLISTQCDEQNSTVDTSGTVAVRGQKPDALIRQAVGLKPGDRYPPLPDLRKEIHERVDNLGLFNVVDSGIAIDANKDPNTITLLICVKQKNEAELAYLEASQIYSSASIEFARQAIIKYQESIQHFQCLKSAPPAGKSGAKNLITLPIMGINMRTVAEKLTEADAFVGLAKTYSSLGEFYQALNCYNRALSLVRMTNERDAEANVLTAIADIYRTLGDRQQAQKYYSEVLSLRLARLRKLEQQVEVER
jgi:tetratricopeptide (TPR) repeat protein